MHGMGRERVGEVLGVKHRGVDRRLQIVIEDGMREEELERPLVLLVGAGRAEGKARLAIAQGH